MLPKGIDEVNKSMVAITTSLPNIPSKSELRLHARTMEEPIVQAAEVDTGLTTTMEGYKFSESLPYNFRTTPAAGPSGTQSVHLQRLAVFGQQSIPASSLRDTESEVSWRGMNQGGAGSNGAVAEAAGGATDGAAGVAR